MQSDGDEPLQEEVYISEHSFILLVRHDLTDKFHCEYMIAIA